MRKDRVAIWIKKAALEVEKLSNQVLAPYELTNTQYKILMMMYRSPEQFIRQRDIETKFSMTNPSVTGIVQNLEKKGLVIRRQSPEDKRSKLVYPTEYARELEPELVQLGKKLEDQITANLQEEECRQLCKLLKKIKIFGIFLCFLLLTAGCSGNVNPSDGIDALGSTDPPGGTTNKSDRNDKSEVLRDSLEDYDISIITPPPGPDFSAERPTRPVTATVILADDKIKIEGSGANARGSILTISADGVYEISGTLSDGQIIIDAPDKAIVELVLSGVDISNSRNAAIYCKNCDGLIITLAENTQNVLSDADNYTYDNMEKQEPNAAIFSKTDLNIGGSGWLTVHANFNHGISSKDDLVIEGGGFTVISADDAIRGKDSLVILDGKFELNAGGDGLKASSSDGAEFGYVQILGGEYTIKACGDAIQAETVLAISGGTFSIATEGRAFLQWLSYAQRRQCGAGGQSGRRSIGDTVVCRGNFLRAREPYGAVIKKSELL